MVIISINQMKIVSYLQSEKISANFFGQTMVQVTFVVSLFQYLLNVGCTQGGDVTLGKGTSFSQGNSLQSDSELSAQTLSATGKMSASYLKTGGLGGLL